MKEVEQVDYNERAIARIEAYPVEYPVRYVLVGDNDWAGNRRWQQLLEQVGQISPSPLFIAFIGDFASPPADLDRDSRFDFQNMRPGPGIQRYEPHIEMIENLSIPAISIVGNHDIEASDGEELYHSHFGPYNFYFDYGHTRFVAIYSAHKNPSHGIAGPRYEDMEFLDSVVRLDGPPNKTLFFHIPPYMEGRYDWMGPSPLLSFRAQESGSFRTFREIVEGSGVRLVNCAHLHGYDSTVLNGIHYVVSGGGGSDITVCEGSLPECSPSRGYFHHVTVVTIRENHSMLVQVIKLGDGTRPDPRYDREIAAR